MNKVKIVCDSTVDLSPELYKKYDIAVIPLHVSFGEDDYLDSQTITLAELYAKVDEIGELPKTASVSPGIFEEEFRKWVDQGFDVFYIGIGSELSGAFKSAYIAQQAFPEGRVTIVDSMNLSTASGILAIHAALLRDKGLSAAEMAEEVKKMAPKVVGQFSVETFDYLYKGGRVTGAVKFVGTLLHIRPYLRVFDGKLLVHKKPRGPMKVAIMEQLKTLKEDLPNVDQTIVFITHALTEKSLLDWTVAELGKLVDPKCIVVTVTGAVIGSHCGPGTLGILYLKK